MVLPAILFSVYNLFQLFKQNLVAGENFSLIPRKQWVSNKEQLIYYLYVNLPHG